MTIPARTDVTPVTGVLLAAGAGARFGGHKLMAPLPAASHGVAGGTPVGAASCLHLIAAVPEVIAVVRPGDRALAAALRDAGAMVLECERCHEGMGASLAAGIEASRPGTGWVVALADMPLIDPATIAAIAGRVAHAASVVLPTFEGSPGHPVGFGPAWRERLSALTGDRGARALVEAAGDDVERLPVSDRGIERDIDSPADLARIDSSNADGLPRR